MKFDELPAEIRYLVLDHCDAHSLARLMLVNREMNCFVKNALASFMTRGLGDKMILGVQPVYETDSARWFEPGLVLNNNNRDFHYDMFPSHYSSQPVSRSQSPEPEEPPEQDKHDLSAQSMLCIDTGANNNEAIVEIDNDFDFTQVYLMVGLNVNNHPTTIFKTAQRIHRTWSEQGDEYLVHNKECTYKVKVEKMDPDYDNEMSQSYRIRIPEFVANSAFLLSKIQDVRPTSVIYRDMTPPPHSSANWIRA